jgi:membrane protein
MKLKNISTYIRSFLFFITEDIWRAYPQDLTKKERRGYTVLKVISLAVKRYTAGNMQRSASALTYSTFLSLIPLLAVLLAIARGFGFHNIVESQLFVYFPGQKEVLDTVFSFVDSYLRQSGEGLFLGLGLVLLLYTVYNLISDIENTFNMIWQIQKGRSYLKRLTNYFSVFLLIPIFLVCSSGISILIATTFDTLKTSMLIKPVSEIIFKTGPVIISIFVFTGLYMYIPNTKVKFKHAFHAGVFAALGFQIFQYLYINGQIWVSKYNAIYGSFALIPLLLLWMQLSWVICLVGAEIAYAGQNIQDFEFESDSKKISRRYLDFLTLSITALIVKRFEAGDIPYTAMEISNHYKIPIRLTKRILYLLMDLKIIIELKDEDNYPAYLPVKDINQITIEYLLNKIDCCGSENFKVDNKETFATEWKTILQTRIDMYANHKDLLIKNL